MQSQNAVSGYLLVSRYCFLALHSRIHWMILKGMVNCQNLRDKGPQNAIVPLGRPRPYCIIILNMRFIPKASLRASSQSQQVHIYLSDMFDSVGETREDFTNID